MSDRSPLELITAPESLIFCARCDGTKIEMCALDDGAFICKEITIKKALGLAEELLKFANQMMDKK